MPLGMFSPGKGMQTVIKILDVLDKVSLRVDVVMSHEDLSAYSGEFSIDVCVCVVFISLFTKGICILSCKLPLMY